MKRVTHGDPFQVKQEHRAFAMDAEERALKVAMKENRRGKVEKVRAHKSEMLASDKDFFAMQDKLDKLIGVPARSKWASGGMRT